MTPLIDKNIFFLFNRYQFNWLITTDHNLTLRFLNKTLWDKQGFVEILTTKLPNQAHKRRVRTHGSLSVRTSSQQSKLLSFLYIRKSRNINVSPTGIP